MYYVCVLVVERKKQTIRTVSVSGKSSQGAGDQSLIHVQEVQNSIMPRLETGGPRNALDITIKRDQNEIEFITQGYWYSTELVQLATWGKPLLFTNLYIR